LRKNFPMTNMHTIKGASSNNGIVKGLEITKRVINLQVLRL
jgi:hypothetical protein